MNIENKITDLAAHKWNSLSELKTYLLTSVPIDITLEEKIEYLVIMFNKETCRNIRINTITNLGYKFKNYDWMEQFAFDNGFIELFHKTYVLLNENNFPIAFMEASKSAKGHRLRSGLDLADKFLKESLKHAIKIDYSEEPKEYIELEGFTDRGPSINVKKAAKPPIVHDVYYPYLNGGPNALIEDFLRSTDPLLILAGTPGGGKSSLIANSVDKYNLIPIMARDVQAIGHPSFISTIIDIHDKVYAKGEGIGEEKELTELDLYWDPILKYYKNNPKPTMNISIHSNMNGYSLLNTMHGSIVDSNKIEGCNNLKIESGTQSYMPIIIIEDADILLRSREDGNMVMQNLLNRLDGLGNDYPVKMIFTTNLADIDKIDEALVRPGRCYGFLNFRKLTADEAVVARKACGFDLLPGMETNTKPMSLAEALQVPRKRIMI